MFPLRVSSWLTKGDFSYHNKRKISESFNKPDASVLLALTVSNKIMTVAPTACNNAPMHVSAATTSVSVYRSAFSLAFLNIVHLRVLVILKTDQRSASLKSPPTVT